MIAAGFKPNAVECSAFLTTPQPCLDDFSAVLGAGLCTDPAAECGTPPAGTAAAAVDAQARLQKLSEGKCAEAYPAGGCKTGGVLPPEKKTCDAAQKPNIPGCTPTCDETKGTWACGTVEPPKKECDAAKKPDIPGCSPECRDDGTWACGTGIPPKPGELSGNYWGWAPAYFMFAGGIGFNGSLEADTAPGATLMSTPQAPITGRLYGMAGLPIPGVTFPHFSLGLGIEVFGGWQLYDTPAMGASGFAPNPTPNDTNSTTLNHAGVGGVVALKGRLDNGMDLGLHLSAGKKWFWGEGFCLGAYGCEYDVSISTPYVGISPYIGYKGLTIMPRLEINTDRRHLERSGTPANWANYGYGIGGAGSPAGVEFMLMIGVTGDVIWRLFGGKP